MRLTNKHFESDGSGYVKLLPEEPEDMWHAHNLILVNDYVTAPTIRRVTTESTSTGSTSSQRVHMDLTIKVKSLDFDPQVGQLHVSGTVSRENKYVKIGSHHTLDLELNRKFSLEKKVDGLEGTTGWDSVSRAQLAEAVDPNKSTEAVAVVMQDGLGNICFLTPNQTILKQRVEVTVPRKRMGTGRSAEHDKGLQKFYTTVLETLLRLLETLMESKDTSTSFPILLASPGFVAAGFLKFIREYSASPKGTKLLSELVKRSAFIVAHSSSGHVHSLTEVLNSPQVKSSLTDTKYARETAVMDNFYKLLRTDEARAWYGPKEVEQAVAKGAVGRGGGILLISNQLFRSQDIGVRRRWVTLVDTVRDVEGGEVRILSSDHESGRRLEGLGGVAAILTFPIEDMDDEEEEA